MAQRLLSDSLDVIKIDGGSVLQPLIDADDDFARRTVNR